MLGITFGTMATAGGGITQTWPTWDGTLDGSATLFESGSSTTAIQTVSCFVDTNKMMVFYRYNSTLKAVILTLTGTSIAVGTAVTVLAAAGQNTTCVAIDTGRVMACYTRNSDGFLEAVVLSVSGTTITVNTPVDVDTSGGAGFLQVVKIDTDQCVVAWASGGNTNTAVCLSTSSTTITVRTPFVITSTTGGSSLSMATLSTTKIFMAWADANTTTAKARVLSIATNTITAGTLNSFHGTAVTGMNVAGLDATHAIAAFKDDTSTNGKAYAFSVSGTTITAGTVATFESSATPSLSGQGNGFSGIDSATAILVYKATNLYGIVFTVSGTTITTYTKVSVATPSSSTVWAATFIDANHVLTTFSDNISAPNGKSIVLSIV